MKEKQAKNKLERLIAEAVQNGLANAVQKKATKKVVKISSTQLAEAVRKAVKKILSENTMATPGLVGSGLMAGGAMPPPGKGPVAGTAAPTQEGVSDGDKVRGKSSFGVIPSDEELQDAIDELGGWQMKLRGEDLESFIDAVEASGMSQMKAMTLMKTGEGMGRVLNALMSSDDENAQSLASGILDVLGWEWI